MHITRLRLVGFKSFVEPTELLVERGLTGVVGPNGCGKSNLLEALRWVMGETSHKSMRAAAMDDVIFSGTSSRPARSWAEVTITLDNRGRTAPASFNEADHIEIARRIEREAGSAYRINGRDARARDVKVLFEDAATGARSPALVRQGQISEIVNAKPEQRRRILEDAAGVAGLHTRRHEADLRLKAAEANLVRIGDILGALNGQVEGLRRQARAARRYREVSAEIRRLEALLFHSQWQAAHQEVVALEADYEALLAALADAVGAEARALEAEIRAAEVIPGLRSVEVERAAAVARLGHELDTLDRDLAQAAARRAEAEALLEQVRADREREGTAAEEAAETVARLEETLTALVEADEEADAVAAAAADRAALADGVVQAAEQEVGGLMRQRFEREARQRELEATQAERQRQVERLRRQVQGCEEQVRVVTAAAAAGDDAVEVGRAADEAAAAAAEAEARLLALQMVASEAAAVAEQERAALAARRVERAALVAERDVIARLAVAAGPPGAISVFDEIEVDPGYELALSAALGAELEAGRDRSLPAFWSERSGVGAQSTLLPAGSEPLARHVRAPDELLPRLAHVGIVERARGDDLQTRLAPGQRLVSREGDLWRWDGFVASREAVATTARRLAERNRLGELEGRLADATATEQLAEAAAAGAAQRTLDATAAARRCEEEVRASRQRAAAALEHLRRLELAGRDAESRIEQAREAREEALAMLEAAFERACEIEGELAALGPGERSSDTLEVAEQRLAAGRAAAASARAEALGLAREQALRSERRRATEQELARWQARSKAAVTQIARLAARFADAERTLASEDLDPDVALDRRSRLLAARQEAEAARTAAAEALATAEDARREAGATLKSAQAEVVLQREVKARIEAQLDAARQKRQGEARRIREALSIAPEECLALAGLAVGEQVPPLDDLDRHLTRARADRERLGGVNLEAESELAVLEDRFAKLDAERVDVEQAVAKLRGAIAQLNREGRKRLMEAFGAVNGHFQRLFTSLFGGGEARLELIESEDPLEGGLEIVAKPPGKKPATLSLLSGGEQTLTALSLIFAVFLTNPSPICVLDEVDAPLDDANVDRFCALMERMASETQTRFLVITHHPMTMARMDRLFGVTMGERGVSQLVSVDLNTAEKMVEVA